MQSSSFSSSAQGQTRLAGSSCHACKDALRRGAKGGQILKAGKGSLVINSRPSPYLPLASLSFGSSVPSEALILEVLLAERSAWEKGVLGGQSQEEKRVQFGSHLLFTLNVCSLLLTGFGAVPCIKP